MSTGVGVGWLFGHRRQSIQLVTKRKCRCLRAYKVERLSGGPQAYGVRPWLLWLGAGPQDLNLSQVQPRNLANARLRKMVGIMCNVVISNLLLLLLLGLSRLSGRRSILRCWRRECRE